MFELNGTYVIFIVSFLIFMMLLNEVMLKPVGKVLEARKAKIQSDLEAAKAARSKAEASVDHYQQHLLQVRCKAQDLINDAVEKANRHKTVELGRLKDDGRKQTKAAIAKESSLLLEQLVQQEITLVGTITEKLLGEPVPMNLDPVKVRRAIEDVSPIKMGGVLEEVS
jgi:F-type H+-transporting ATPase subunit b